MSGSMLAESKITLHSYRTLYFRAPFRLTGRPQIREITIRMTVYLVLRHPIDARHGDDECSTDA